MSIYSDKLVQVHVVINCPYAVAQLCTREDMLAHTLGQPYFDVMSYNSLTTVCFSWHQNNKTRNVQNPDQKWNLDHSYHLNTGLVVQFSDVSSTGGLEYQTCLVFRWWKSFESWLAWNSNCIWKPKFYDKMATILCSSIFNRSGLFENRSLEYTVHTFKTYRFQMDMDFVCSVFKPSLYSGFRNSDR